MKSLRPVVCSLVLIMLAGCYPQFYESIPADRVNLSLEGIWCQSEEDCYDISSLENGYYQAGRSDDDVVNVDFVIKKYMDEYYLEIEEETNVGMVYSIFWIENGDIKNKISLRRIDRDFNVVCSEAISFENKETKAVLVQNQRWSGCRAPIALFTRALGDLSRDELFNSRSLVFKRK